MMRRISRSTRGRAAVSARSCLTAAELNTLGSIYVAPRQVVRLSGALGPLQASGVAGSMTWKLTGDADNTRLELSYSVGGFIDGGFDKIAPAVEAMLHEQVDRLKLFAETGKPTTT